MDTENIFKYIYLLRKFKLYLKIMKQFILLILFFLIFLPSHSQTGSQSQEDMRYGRHIFEYDVVLTKCNLDGNPVNGSDPQVIEDGTIFYITRIVGNDDYIIRIAKYTKGTKKDAKNLAFVENSKGKPFYYKITSSQYNSDASRLEKKGTFTVGAATTLIKVRPGKKEAKDGYNIYSEFGNDFNIGVSAGWKFQPYRLMDLSHSIVVGLSFSSIKVTPYTTRGYIDSESTQACLTFSLGYVFEYNKFQFTPFLGLDVMSGEVGRNWIYKNRPWIGLGFGYQIFRSQGENKIGGNK